MVLSIPIFFSQTTKQAHFLLLGAPRTYSRMQKIAPSHAFATETQRLYALGNLQGRNHCLMWQVACAISCVSGTNCILDESGTLAHLLLLGAPRTYSKMQKIAPSHAFATENQRLYALGNLQGRNHCLMRQVARAISCVSGPNCILD